MKGYRKSDGNPLNVQVFEDVLRVKRPEKSENARVFKAFGAHLGSSLACIHGHMLPDSEMCRWLGHRHPQEALAVSKRPFNYCLSAAYRLFIGYI